MVHRRLVTPRSTALTALVAIVVVTVATCSSGDDDGPGATASTTTSTTVAKKPTDGRLTIGLMQPPAASLLRESLLLGARRAVDEINAAGGSFGGTVELVTVDEGDTVATARDAIESLLTDEVDAIIGPTSSVIALSTLESITSDDVVACSPTAATIALDEFPDGGLFFRTVPSDSLQAAAIVGVAEGTGVQSVTVVYVDDDYGRPYADAVLEGLASESIDVAERVGFASDDDDLDEEVGEVIESGAGVIILLASGDDGTQFLEALSDLRPSQIVNVIVNDALLSSESSQRLADLWPHLRESILGVTPQAAASDPAIAENLPGPFATNAFDCVTLIALAAESVQSDAASDIAGAMPLISIGGSVCRTYANCVERLRRDLEIDYNGASGLIDIGAASGDSMRGGFDRFSIDEQGNEVIDGDPLIL